jgi:hypothetical protein
MERVAERIAASDIAKAAVLAASGVWVGIWLWFSRESMLDDALIHLRVADDLRRGVIDSGSSSPLWVGLLAAVSSVLKSPLVPKVLSILAYLGFLALVLARARTATRASKVALIVLLIGSISPLGIRWLTDGMETSLVALATGGLAFVAVGEATRARCSAGRYSALVAFGLLLTTLRVVEGCFLIAFATLFFVVARLQEERNLGLGRATAIALNRSHLLLGALAGVIVDRAVYGTILPDTAVAKNHGSALWDSAYLVAHTIGSSISFGLALCLAYAVSSAFLLHRISTSGQRAWAALALISLVPVGLLVIVTSGEGIQGIRHLSWLFVFPTVANTLLLDRMPDRTSHPLPALAGARWALAILAVIVISWAIEGPIAVRVADAHTQTFRRMSSMHLQRLQNRNGIAYDVGFIWYFSHGRICDADGLINGHAFAALSPKARLKRCLARPTDFLFVDDAQLAELQRASRHKFTGWTVCARFRFDNVATTDAHLLVVPSRLATTLCPHSRAVVKS